MTLAAMTQEARPARHPGALRGNGPANNDSAGPVAQAGPGSSLAGAYLNQFDEMVKLIERLPGTPELIGDLLIWQPTSYQDYFTASAMPGRRLRDRCLCLIESLRAAKFRGRCRRSRTQGPRRLGRD